MADPREIEVLMHGEKWLLGLFLVLFALLLPAMVPVASAASVVNAASATRVDQTYPASFPCEMASTKLEKSICHSQVLAALDVEMAKTYKLVLSEVSEGRQSILTADQRAWLRNERNGCALKPDEKPEALSDETKLFGPDHGWQAVPVWAAPFANHKGHPARRVKGRL